MEVAIYPNSEAVPKNILLPKQCHGDNIVEVVTGDEDLFNCDALITKNRSTLLGIRTADCAPVCFSDGEYIGIAHIGWRGLCLGLIEKMLGKFKRENLEVFGGPFNHSFEIKKDFCYEEIKAKFGEKFFVENEGQITFLFKDAIMSLLPEQAEFDSRNTFSDPSLPSFRRCKAEERLVTVISFK
ncbi:MAG: polyphenol oxidase family protein [bacterium]|nr:polyphenol oxidase family protein [bacterium]